MVRYFFEHFFIVSFLSFRLSFMQSRQSGSGVVLYLNDIFCNISLMSSSCAPCKFKGCNTTREHAPYLKKHYHGRLCNNSEGHRWAVIRANKLRNVLPNRGRKHSTRCGTPYRKAKNIRHWRHPIRSGGTRWPIRAMPLPYMWPMFTKKNKMRKWTSLHDVFLYWHAERKKSLRSDTTRTETRR